MTAFSRSGDLQGAEFIDADLRGARFVRTDLSGVVMRAVDVQETDIDAPRLFHSGSFLRVNGVDVIPLIEAELNRRFPGRADRCAGDPDGLRAAWAVLEHTWAATLATVTPDQLAEPRKNPWAPEYQQSTLSCLHVILREEWEHHRYAVRDLEAIEAKSGG